MFLLHFQKRDEEYITLTESPESEWSDHAKPGFALETAIELGPTLKGDEGMLPAERGLIDEDKA